MKHHPTWCRNRSRGVLSVVLFALCAFVTVDALASTSILVLVGDNQAARLPQLRATFLAAMRERGLSSDDLASIQFRLTPQDGDSLRKVANEIDRSSARVVVASTFLILRGLLPVVERPPIVFYASVSDLLQRLPELADLKAARATGINAQLNVEAKMLELLTLASGDVKRVCAMSSSVNVKEDGFRRLRMYATQAAMQVEFFTVDRTEDLVTLLHERAFQGCDGLIVFVHKPLMDAPRAYIEKINALGLPAIYTTTSLGQFGALIAIEPNVMELRQYMYDQVAALSRGAPIEMWPIATADRFAIGINVPAMRLLAKPLSKQLILRATEFYYE